MYCTINPYTKIIFCCAMILTCSISFAAPRHVTDELSLSHKYGYRLITRQLAIDPNQRFSDSVKPFSFREIAILNPGADSFNKYRAEKQSDSISSFYKHDEVYGDGLVFEPLKEVRALNFSSSKANSEVPANFGVKITGNQNTVLGASGSFNVNNYFIFR